MLNKLLPFKENPQKNQPQQKEGQKPLDPLEELRKSPNLFDRSLYKVSPIEQFRTTTSRSSFWIVAILILGLHIALLSLTGAHLLINSEISASAKKVNALEEEILSKKLVKEQTQNLVEKIQIHKEVMRDRKLLGPILNVVFSEIPNDMTIKTANIDASEARLDVTTNSVLSFSRLINNYFETKLVNEVTLKNANFNPRLKSYEMELGVVFK